MRRFIAKITDWLRSREDAIDARSTFVDLAPTEDADEGGVYAEALLYAIQNPRVSNIALTGPYGSGKSSIIRSFLKRHPQDVLQISLAAFLPGTSVSGGDASRQEIERSILQQMFYGAKADQLPFSRFKRIRSPARWSLPLSLYAILGVVACWHLLERRDQVIDGTFLFPLSAANWPNLVWLSIGTSFLWLAVHRAYEASLGVSFKSISLKEVEFASVPISQDSILNRHLDEIIYFFQSTKYDLVVIEDLDRFDDAEIFVTLREINALVNANAGVRRTIRFLYALRDDMFLNVDRTKFFEFIVPVIPIINSSNSIDKVIEQQKRLSLHDRLDRQFLREVSRYLDDLRLIRNIFNEYAIYVANLETEGDGVLDANKLLAVLIYKNVFPRDFEELHRGRGALARILGRHEEFVAIRQAENKARFERLEREIEVGERQVPADLKDLRRIYAMALFEKLPIYATHILGPSSTPIALNELAKTEGFDEIIGAQSIRYQSNQMGQQSMSIAGLQAEVDPSRTYQERRGEVQRRGGEFKASASRKLQALRSEDAALRFARFNEVARLDEEGLADLFGAFGDDEDLARFLILEGHLDDTYYQYTSLFHSGRLSPNDNRFLIQIRGFRNPNPQFPIDNAREVVAAMRDDDFRQCYVLNVRIVDCLLGDGSAHAGRVADLFEYVASNFEACGTFLTDYYATGAEVPGFLAGLLAAWPDLVPTILADPEGLRHVGRLVAELPRPALRGLPSEHPEITRFVSRNLANILALGIEVEPPRLKDLDVRVEDMGGIEGFPGTLRFLFEEGLYAITVENVESVVRSVVGVGDLEPLRRRHLTTVGQISNAHLSARIERDFDDYIRNVLLRLETNTRESPDAIASVLGHDNASFEDLRAFLEKQAERIRALDDVPTRFHALLFQLGRIEATWANCLSFVVGEAFDAPALTTFLEMPTALAALPAEPIPDDEGASALRRFLIEDDALNDASYRTYVRMLPPAFESFPDVDPLKLRILVEEARVEFTKNNVDALEAQHDLQILFVALNVDAYLERHSGFDLGDDFDEKLLAEDIGDARRLAIVRTMDLSSLPRKPGRAALVGAILARTGADIGDVGPDAARAIIANSAPIPIQIALLNRFRDLLDDDEVRRILADLPAPFSEITVGHRVPQLEKTDVNVDLVRWLDGRNIISSWRETFLGDAIRIYLYRRDGLN